MGLPAYVPIKSIILIRPYYHNQPKPFIQPPKPLSKRKKPFI